MPDDELERFTIKYHDIDEGTDCEIEIMARDIKHARRLAGSRMDRKPHAITYTVVEG